MTPDKEGVEYAHRIVKDIRRMGGLVKWDEFSVNMAFIRESGDNIEDLEDLINFFTEYKDIKTAQYLINELAELKNHIKENI